MGASHVVVDGSNIATEGRSMPSLRQLDQAVRQFQDEFPDAETIVVVDATFGHRIEPEDRKAFEDAVAHGELVSPPAGAIGRGDAFVLRIAERVSGQVLSNDSFQEFHEEHPWLFDEGRLIGGKPVPGVGWIFTLRTPVRGPRSRPTRRGRTREAAGAGETTTSPPRRRSAAVLAAVEAAAAEATEAASGGPVQDAPGVGAPEVAPAPRRRRRRRRGGGDPEVKAAIEAATEEAITADGASSAGRRPARGAKPVAETVHGPEAVNDPLTFLTFIAEHPLGDEVVGTVSTFVSHGAMVDVGDMHCYVPLSGLALPAPKSAREVLRRGETRPFVVVALDPPRRGAQLALPEFAASEGEGAPGADSGEPAAPRKARSSAKAATVKEAPAKEAPAKEAPQGKKAPAKEAAPTTKTAATKTATAVKKPPQKKAAAAKKAVAKKALPATKATAKKAASGSSRRASAAAKDSGTSRTQPTKKRKGEIAKKGGTS